jgi:hypothetical protein
VFLIHASGLTAVPFQSAELDKAWSVQEKRRPAELRFHKEWIEKIPRGQLIVAENVSHSLINFENPQLVINTVRHAVRPGM